MYEPSAFFFQKQFGEGAAAFAEIKAVADAAASGLGTGDYNEAARTFIDYSGGSGSWAERRPEVRRELIRWLPKVVLDFAALFNEPTPIDFYAKFSFPVLLLRGEHAPPPTRLVAEKLASVFTNVRYETVAGAGYMGPFTHAEEVNALIAKHIRAVSFQVESACGLA